MKETLHEKQTFDAILINLYQILTWITERISKYFNQKDIEKIQLATEEAIVNIIKHGYKKKKGKIEIELIINDYLSLIIKDKAPKFNPFSKKEKNKKNICKKKIGGLGIFLIFKCIDKVNYKRENGYNILTLKKKRNLKY